MSSFRSAWAGAPAGIAVARTGQSVPLLSAAAALAVAMTVGGWLSGARHASAIDAVQPLAEKVLAYNRHLYEIFSDTQT
ncbi:hypothetical protein ACQCRF_24255, partial [Ralstonia pseudosolanacearum]